MIVDPNLARFYEEIRLITRGPLWSGRRMQAIWKLNTGGYRHLIDVDYYRNPPPSPEQPVKP
jgi:arabinofuranosyltransferase